MNPRPSAGTGQFPGRECNSNRTRRIGQSTRGTSGVGRWLERCRLRTRSRQLLGSPHPTRTNPDSADEDDRRWLRMAPEVGRSWRYRQLRVPLANSVLASGTRGCRGREGGLAGRQVALDHPFEESDRVGEDSTPMRGSEPKRGLALQFNRFPDQKARKTALLQWFRKARNHCVEYGKSADGCRAYSAVIRGHRFARRVASECRISFRPGRRRRPSTISRSIGTASATRRACLDCGSLTSGIAEIWSPR